MQITAYTGLFYKNWELLRWSKKKFPVMIAASSSPFFDLTHNGLLNSTYIFTNSTSFIVLKFIVTDCGVYGWPCSGLGWGKASLRCLCPVIHHPRRTSQLHSLQERRVLARLSNSTLDALQSKYLAYILFFLCFSDRASQYNLSNWPT